MGSTLSQQLTVLLRHWRCALCVVSGILSRERTGVIVACARVMPRVCYPLTKADGFVVALALRVVPRFFLSRLLL